MATRKRKTKSKSQACVILTSAGDAATARRIAKGLLAARVAACVNVVPGVESHYRWKGKTESAREILLIIKTTAAHAKAVESKIKSLHTYELPECVVIPISGGSKNYLQWLFENVN